MSNPNKTFIIPPPFTNDDQWEAYITDELDAWLLEDAELDTLEQLGYKNVYRDDV